jgi:hypothetical protein
MPRRILDYEFDHQFTLIQVQHLIKFNIIQVQHSVHSYTFIRKPIEQEGQENHIYICKTSELLQFQIQINYI